MNKFLIKLNYLLEGMKVVKRDFSNKLDKNQIDLINKIVKKDLRKYQQFAAYLAILIDFNSLNDLYKNKIQDKQVLTSIVDWLFFLKKKKAIQGDINSRKHPLSPFQDLDILLKKFNEYSDILSFGKYYKPVRSTPKFSTIGLTKNDINQIYNQSGNAVFEIYTLNGLELLIKNNTKYSYGFDKKSDVDWCIFEDSFWNSYRKERRSIFVIFNFNFQPEDTRHLCCVVIEENGSIYEFQNRNQSFLAYPRSFYGEIVPVFPGLNEYCNKHDIPKSLFKPFLEKYEMEVISKYFPDLNFLEKNKIQYNKSDITKILNLIIEQELEENFQNNYVKNAILTVQDIPEIDQLILKVIGGQIVGGKWSAEIIFEKCSFKNVIIGNVGNDPEVICDKCVWDNSGKWFQGEWSSGIWKNGIWNGGVFERSRWENGTWKEGVWDESVWENGKWETGYFVIDKSSESVLKLFRDYAFEIYGLGFWAVKIKVNPFVVGHYIEELKAMIKNSNYDEARILKLRKEIQGK